MMLEKIGREAKDKAKLSSSKLRETTITTRFSYWITKKL